MNLVDELRNLDVNDVGRWPIIFRAAVIGILFTVVLSMGGGLLGIAVGCASAYGIKT